MRKIANVQEVLTACEALSTSETLRLRTTASVYLRGTQYTEPCDLLHEAIYRTLKGKRLWPIAVPFNVFLKRAMKSIADADRNSSWTRLACESWLEVCPHCDRLEVDDNSPMLDTVLIARQAESSGLARARAIQFALRNESISSLVLQGLLYGHSSSELMGIYSLSPKEYRNARRRLAAVVRALQEGWK